MLTETEEKSLKAQNQLMQDIIKGQDDFLRNITHTCYTAMRGEKENYGNENDFYIPPGDDVTITLPGKDLSRMLIILRILANSKNHDEIPDSRSTIESLKIRKDILKQLT